jgi:hypothetical protein
MRGRVEVDGVKVDDLTRRTILWHLKDLPRSPHIALIQPPGIPLPTTPPPDPADKDALVDWWQTWWVRWSLHLVDLWPIKTGQERRALRRVAKQYGRPGRPLQPWAAKATLCNLALIDAVNDADKPVRIRIGQGPGSGFVRDEDGQVAHRAPLSFSSVGQAQWLEQEALRRARALLADLGGIDHSPPEEMEWSEEAESRAALDVPAPDDALIAEERTRHVMGRIDEALAVATPRERQILLAYASPEIAATLEARGVVLTPADRKLLSHECRTFQDVADLLRISTVGQVTSQMSRVRRKLKP